MIYWTDSDTPHSNILTNNSAEVSDFGSGIAEIGNTVAFSSNEAIAGY